MCSARGWLESLWIWHPLLGYVKMSLAERNPSQDLHATAFCFTSCRPSATHALSTAEVHCKTFQPSVSEIHDSFPLPTLRSQQPSPSSCNTHQALPPCRTVTIDSLWLKSLAFDFFPFGKGLRSDYDTLVAINILICWPKSFPDTRTLLLKNLWSPFTAKAQWVSKVPWSVHVPSQRAL